MTSAVGAVLVVLVAEVVSAARVGLVGVNRTLPRLRRPTGPTQEPAGIRQ